jgi:hypothetical protein
LTGDSTAGEVTVTAVRADDPGRWVRLTLAIRGDDGVDGFLTHAVPFTCDIKPLDERSAGYDLENWESGLLSGYFYVCRRAGRKPPPRLRVCELSGALGSMDMLGVVRAAELAAARLFGADHDPAAGEWVVAVTASAAVTA